MFRRRHCTQQLATVSLKCRIVEDSPGGISTLTILDYGIKLAVKTTVIDRFTVKSKSNTNEFPSYPNSE